MSPIPLYPLVTGRAEVYQKYFDLVQSNKEKDLRVQFNPLGSAKDGYTHTIVRVILPPQATTFSQKPLRGRLAEILSFRMQEVIICFLGLKPDLKFSLISRYVITFWMVF